MPVRSLGMQTLNFQAASVVFLFSFVPSNYSVNCCINHFDFFVGREATTELLYLVMKIIKKQNESIWNVPLSLNKLQNFVCYDAM